jgi:hypothetical protein
MSDEYSGALEREVSMSKDRNTATKISIFKLMEANFGDELVKYET